MSFGDWNWVWVNIMYLGDYKLQFAGWDKIIWSKLASDISWDVSLITG